MKNHFKCIGIVGHPRHPTALTTHEMLWRWLCSKGYVKCWLNSRSPMNFSSAT